MNYDKQFAQARKRIYDYIDRGCRTEIQWLMDVYKQTGTMCYQSQEDLYLTEDELLEQAMLIEDSNRAMKEVELLVEITKDMTAHEFIDFCYEIKGDNEK